jgi:hypothetical protein
VKNNTPNLKKLSDRSRRMIFVGYEPGSAAYMCYDLATRKVHISRDVVFYVEGVWDWSVDQATEMSFDFSVAEQEIGFFQTTETRLMNDVVPEVQDVVEVQQQRADHSPVLGYRTTVPGGAGTPISRGAGAPLSDAENLSRTPPSENLDADHDGDAPLRYRRLADLLDPGSPPGQATRNPTVELFLADGEEPATFNQAEQDISCRRAMGEEISSIVENNTWELVDLPASHKPIGLKWVYKLKKDHSPVLGYRTTVPGGAGTPISGGAGTPLSDAENLSRTPPSENLDADHDEDAPLRYRRLADLLDPGSPPGQATRNPTVELFLADGEEPATFNQAEQDISCRRAMGEEISSIVENNTWELVDLPASHKPIGLKWVYKLKKDASGMVVKHKARLVEKRYVQRGN